MKVHVSSYKFGVFELDPAKFELRRDGFPVKLERIPMELLILLVEREGNVVSRQEIVERLWGKDVFVDTEHGINVAVRKIRAVLHDDAEHPLFVQTVLGKGYRFVGVSPSNGDGVNSTAVAAAPALMPEPPDEEEFSPEHAAHDAEWRRWMPLVSAVLLLFVFASAIFLFNVGGIQDRILSLRRSGKIRSIAVIPLANLSGDPAQDYFADGMTDEIITMLAKNSSLRVVSHTSAMQYKGAKRPVGDIARELGVDGVLEGSVERSGNRVHMTVQLIHAASDSHIWADSYDRDFNEAFSIPAELSQTIAKKLDLPNPATTTGRTINPEAHDAYLRGRYFWFAGPNMQRSQDEFKRAIKLQPDYGLAWGGLADAYIVQAVFNEVPVKDVLDQADEAVRKAVELDDQSAEVHNAMAGVKLFGHWDPKHADEEALRSISLNGKYGEIHHLRAYILLALNRPEEALQEQRICTELDRMQRPWAMGKVLAMVRKYDEAIQEYKVLLDAQPEDKYGWFLISDVYRYKGMMAEAAASKSKGYRNNGNEKEAREVERLFRRGGDKAVQEWELRRKKALIGKEYVSSFDLASLAARTGNKAETIKYLEAAYDERVPWLVMVQFEADFDLVHGEEGYREIIRKMGLPPAW